MKGSVQRHRAWIYITRLVILAVGLLSVSGMAYAQYNDEVCPAEYSYEECIDHGYFNDIGNGVGGGGGGGGYCQNVIRSVAIVWVQCSDGNTYDCPIANCWNSPESNKYCDPPITAGCCPDGTHEGQDVVQKDCR